MAVSPNSSVDVTLRISQPQLEPTSAATPYIPTRGGARTVIDYVLDERKQIHLGEAPPIGATLTWDGSVGVDVGTSLLPPNATTLERTAEAVTARSFDIDTVVGLLWNPATCPENLLPWLAWTMSVDTWRNSWPLAVKRARVANSLIVQRRKGTARSIADVVDSFGGVVDITEWWQTTPRGAPHTFALTLTLGGQDGETTTAQYVDDVIAEVNFTKPVRSHFTFTQGINLAARVGVIAATRAAVFVRLQATEATTP
ncbi:phage tail protein I [Stenotrophomonas maltophilia]|nr:phage tail protein I [Stenotrophomonas maltophilia]MBH1558486.1 phage tail protein I [Stenotrophomonas maltophilia]